MINLLNTIKALIICILISGTYTLHASTSAFQAQLAREGQEVGKIEALMHYSSLMDVWSRMLSGWFHLFILCFISCLLLMLWLNTSKKTIKSWPPLCFRPDNQRPFLKSTKTMGTLKNQAASTTLYLLCFICYFGAFLTGEKTSTLSFVSATSFW